MIVTTGVNDDNMCHCVMYNCSMCIANVLTLAVRCCTCRIRSDRRLALPASLLCDVVLSVACRFRLRGLVDVDVGCSLCNDFLCFAVMRMHSSGKPH